MALVGYGIARNWPEKQRLGLHVDGLPQVLFGASVDVDDDTLALRYAPGVFLHEILAQTQDRARLPWEAAVAVVVDVARAVDRLRIALGQVGAPQAPAIRVLFGGGVELYSPARTFDAWRDPIGALPLYHGGPRRAVPFDLPIPPEALDDPNVQRLMALVDAGNDRVDRELVWNLGSLLHFLLAGEAPYADEHPLLVVDRVRRDDRNALGRDDVPAAVLQVLDAALAPAPADRPATPGTLAALLAPTVPLAEARALLGCVARGLFPLAARAQEGFLEEAAFSDDTDVDVAVPVVPRDAEERFVTKVRGRPVALDCRPVTNAQLVAFLDATGTPDPDGFLGRLPELARRPAVYVPWRLADAYARHHGARLPDEDEWAAAIPALLASRRRADDPLVGGVWEWTATPVFTPKGWTFRDICGDDRFGDACGGFVVRGGPWRNRDEPARPDNRSWEDEGCVDVGFRCIVDLPEPRGFTGPTER